MQVLLLLLVAHLVVMETVLVAWVVMLASAAVQLPTTRREPHNVSIQQVPQMLPPPQAAHLQQ
jgi:hypothetical protein